MSIGDRAASVFLLSVLFIVYVYCGYPLLIFLLARLRRPPRYADATPHVTLIIAAYNEAAVIAAKLENSLALDYPPDKLQILVAADGSEDETVQIVSSFATRGVALSYSAERRGKSAALTRAAPQARGEVLVFSDANNLYARDTVRELVRPFADAAVGAACGAKTLLRDGSAHGGSEGLYWRYEDFIKRQESRLGSSIGAAGEVFALRRELFEPLPAHIINDDFYLALRVARRGFRVVYAPAARSYERASATAAEELQRRARIVAGRYQALASGARLLPINRPLLLWQLLSHKYFRPLVPLAMIAALGANLLAVLIPPTRAGSGLLAALTLGLQLVFYLLALVGRRAPLGRTAYLPTFLVHSNLAALKGLFDFLANRATVLWSPAQRRRLDSSVVPAHSLERER